MIRDSKSINTRRFLSSLHFDSSSLAVSSCFLAPQLLLTFNMFFKLIHPYYNRKTLTGTISSDGVVFFRTTDVANILNLSDKSHYGKRCGQWQIKDILYKKLQLEHPSVLKYRVVSRTTAANLLNNSKKADASRFANVLMEWDKYYVSVSDNWTPSTKLNEAVLCFLLPENETNELSLKDFIMKFSTKTLELYEQLSTKKHSCSMDIFHESLEKMNLQEPPTIINMYFGDGRFRYTLSE